MLAILGRTAEQVNAKGLLREAHAAEVVQCLAMPTCVLRCESCRVHTPHFIHEEMLPEVQSGKAVPKHCPVCRTTTDWMFVFLERRSGRERRQIADRRTPTP